jgi:transcriptional regulator with XRE-family HTH domain
MATAQRVSSLAASRTASVLRNLGDEVRQGRLSRGLSQLEVARVASISQAKVSQIERASLATVSIRDVCHLLAAVGMELSARAYPAGPPLRDAAHRALLERLRARIGQSVRWKFEVPLPITGDLRAWDAVMELANVRVAVEAETRVRDVQALQRRVSLKLRDDPNTTRVVLLLADTRANREMVRAEERILSDEYPLSARAMLASLSEGRAPESSGVVLL